MLIIFEVQQKSILPVLLTLALRGRQGVKTIGEVYGVREDELRVFVHYLPQFYHFHVHFSR